MSETRLQLLFLITIFSIYKLYLMLFVVSEREKSDEDTLIIFILWLLILQKSSVSKQEEGFSPPGYVPPLVHKTMEGLWV